MFGIARQDDVEDHVVARILAFGGGDIGQGSALVGLKPGLSPGVGDGETGRPVARTVFVLPL